MLLLFILGVRRKGISITTKPNITPFWYRRICEVTLLLSLVIIGLWFAGLSIDSPFFDSGLILPSYAAVGAGITAVLSATAYFLSNKRWSFVLLLLAYLSIATTTFLIVYDTGHINSPFIAFWMFIGIFSGLFGIYAFGPIVILAAAYGTYLVMSGEITSSELTMFALAFGLPVIVSYLLWHQNKANLTAQDRTMNALAQELSQVANQSDIVINAIGDGVIAVDGQGIIQVINPAAQTIIGWGRDDALQLDYRSVLKIQNEEGQVLGDESDPVQQCFHTNQSITSDDLVIETSSGKKLMVSLLVSPVGTGANGAIIVFRDITKQKSEEREQAEFVSTASHEMRTPVAAIEGYLGLALNPQTATVDDKARLYLEKAHESAQHLGRLFQDLLDVSKAEDGRLNTSATAVDVITFVRDIVTAFQVSAQQKSLNLVFKPDITKQGNNRLTPQFYTHADVDHYREIISNLIENALKYTKAGDVTVDVKGNDQHVIVSVKDTGIGIPKEDIPHLFQKFYRVDNSDTREIGGTGLGLYLCRRLAEAMSGRVWAESDYGNGSTFHLETPRLSPEEAEKKLNPTNQPETPFPLNNGTNHDTVSTPQPETASSPTTTSA